MKNLVNWHLEETVDLDASIRRPEDPRPLETLEEIVSPGFDERGTILSNPFPPHRPRLAQLDRHIHETCALGGSKVLMPHSNERTPRHMTVEYIQKLAGCNSDDGRRLLDCFIPLEATEQMVRMFSSMVRERGVDAVVSYLERFVLGVVEVEMPSDATEPWMLEPTEAGEPYGGLFGRAGLCEDVDVEPVQFERHEFSEPDEAGVSEVVTSDHYEWDPTEDLEWDPEEVESNSAPSTIAYHVLEDFNRRSDMLQELNYEIDTSGIYKAPIEEIERLYLKYCGWMARQSRPYIQIIKRIRKTSALPELKQLGKTLHSKTTFSRDQASVLWTEYHQRRKRLERQISLSCTTIGIFRKIELGVDLPSFGRYLYKLQNGRIKVAPVPTEDEWRLIWRAWKTKRLPQLLGPIKIKLLEAKDELKALAA